MVLIFREAYAVLPNPRLPGNAAGQPLLFTNLRSAAPKVLLNAELGDSGVPGPGHRGRWADEVGYDPRLHTIRSLRKVTVWGSTFAVSDLDPLLVAAIRVLPDSVVDGALRTDDVLLRTIDNLDLRSLLANVQDQDDLNQQITEATTQAVKDSLVDRLHDLL